MYVPFTKELPAPLTHTLSDGVLVGVGVDVTVDVGVAVGETSITFIIPAILEWNWQL